MIKGQCVVSQVTPGMEVEFVGLYAGRNVIVDDTYNFGVNTGYATAPAADGDQVNLSLDLNGMTINSTPGSLPSTGIIYARMGLKIRGIDAMLFTEPVQLSFNP